MHLGTGVVAISFTGLVLGKLGKVHNGKHDWSESAAFEAEKDLPTRTQDSYFPVNNVFFNSTPEFLKLTGYKTILPGKNDGFCIYRIV